MFWFEVYSVHIEKGAGSNHNARWHPEPSVFLLAYDIDIII